MNMNPSHPIGLRPGTANFKSQGKIGEGGFGYVEKILIIASNAANLPVGEYFARKLLNAKWNAEPTARARFEREIKAMHSMNHPNIVPYRGEDLGNSNERFYLMPLYERNARHWLAVGGPTGKWRSVAKHGQQLANAMEHAHQLGFLHRDLKPENILYNDGGRLAIADWGLGYFVHKHSKVLRNLTRGGMGTEYYCPMEQWATGKTDATGDIYALGMVLDELVRGGQRPLANVGVGVQTPSVPPDTQGALLFNNLLGHMTRPLARQRPRSMAVVAARFSEIIQTR